MKTTGSWNICRHQYNFAQRMGAAGSVRRSQQGLCDSASDGHASTDQCHVSHVSTDQCDTTFPQECWFCYQLNVDDGTMSDTIDLPSLCCKTCHARLGLPSSSKELPWMNDGELSALRQKVGSMTVVQKKPSSAGCGITICGICRNDFAEKEYALRLSCGHTFHKSCICPWFEHYTSCPTCRYETKGQRDNMMIDELLSNHTEQQLRQRLNALQYLAATVSEIGNIDSSDVYMSHLISGNLDSTKSELATKLHLLQSASFLGTSSIEN